MYYDIFTQHLFIFKYQGECAQIAYSSGHATTLKKIIGVLGLHLFPNNGTPITRICYTESTYFSFHQTYAVQIFERVIFIIQCDCASLFNNLFPSRTLLKRIPVTTCDKSSRQIFFASVDVVEADRWGGYRPRAYDALLGRGTAGLVSHWCDCWSRRLFVSRVRCVLMCASSDPRYPSSSPPSDFFD